MTTVPGGRGRSLLIGGSLALVGVLSVYALTKLRRRRGDDGGASSTTGSQSRGVGGDKSNVKAGFSPQRSGGTSGVPVVVANSADADRILAQLFEQATKQVAELPDSAATQSDRLLLYALYKQATVGDRNISQPSRFNVVAHAKYTAWGQFQGMEKQAAMIKYVEAAQYLQRGDGGGGVPLQDDNADIVYSDDDAYESSDDEGDEVDGAARYGGQSSSEVSGMGLRPSTLAGLATDGHNDGVDDHSAGSGDDGGGASPRKRILIRAAIDSDLPRLQDAIDTGTDVSEPDETGQTALHFAADRGAADCVRLLLENGADPNSVDREGISVLQAAVIGGDVETVRILLEAGGDPDHEDIDGDTPRTCASDDGDEEMRALFS